MGIHPHNAPHHNRPDTVTREQPHLIHAIIHVTKRDLFELGWVERLYVTYTVRAVGRRSHRYTGIGYSGRRSGRHREVIYQKAARASTKSTLKMINLRRWSIQKPKGRHTYGHTGPSKESGRNAGSPHRRDPTLKGSDDIKIRPTSNDGCVAVPVIEEIGELETR